MTETHRKPTAFLMTPADGRPTANAYWMDIHLQIIPWVESSLDVQGFNIVWLHDKDGAITSVYEAKKAGLKLMSEMQQGDLIVPITTGWNWPAHAGIVFTMAQEAIQKLHDLGTYICHIAYSKKNSQEHSNG